MFLTLFPTNELASFLNAIINDNARLANSSSNATFKFWLSRALADDAVDIMHPITGFNLFDDNAATVFE
ncbi:hypothetical protein ONZ45_g12606 [Pleurotus djamor]|nr:hypothetical protein ONZ45_g12606 [Pleurotus djamor]